MATRTDDFDGYRKWLNITSTRRPPTHYELLGIKLDEDDKEVVESALEQRRNYVESKRGKGQDELVAEILMRIDEAGITLLNGEMRRDYDRKMELFKKRRKNRRVDPNATSGRFDSRPGRVVGEEPVIVKTFAGIMAVICVGLGIMAWFSFQLPWAKKEEKTNPVPAVIQQVEPSAQSSHVSTASDATPVDNVRPATPIVSQESAEPSNSLEQLQAGDRLWALAESEKQSSSKSNKQKQAVNWYGKAMRELTDDQKKRVQQRLTSLVTSWPSVSIAANQSWQIGKKVKRGDLLITVASGSWNIWDGGEESWQCDANGTRYKADGPDGHLFPIMGGKQGVLIGQIGTKVFVVGSFSIIEAEEDGDFKMMCNDAEKFRPDNRGSIQVQIAVIGDNSPVEGVKTSSADDAPELTKATYDKWKTFIMPSDQEVAYRKLNWHTSLPAAVNEARSKDKPILLWNYHGHPLGTGCHNGVITRNCFADEEVQRLSKDFILVADNAGRLDREKTYPGYDFFKKALPNNTDGYAQGIYVITPSGKVLGREKWKSYGDVGVPELMHNSMNVWKTMSKEERTKQVKTDVGTMPEAKLYPEDGLVLHFYTRDLIRDETPESKDWNQDFVWFQQHEAKQFLPVTLKVGQKSDVPSFLIQRFVQFVLLDSVHGGAWQMGHGKEGVKMARLTSNITSIKNNVVEIELEGETRTETEGVWNVDHEEPSFKKRGYATRLLGKAAFDTDKQSFVSFEIVGCGTRFGASFFRKDGSQKPIGCVMVLAGKEASERIRPDHLDDYNWQQQQEMSPITQKDDERLVAEGVIGAGGRLDVLVDGKKLSIEKWNALPNQGFRIARIDVSDLPKVVDGDLQRQPDLSELRELILARTSISEEAFVHLNKFKKLVELNVAGTSVNGSGFRYLKGNESIEILLCGGSPITDSNLAHLKSCKHLSLLGLIDTKVTDAGLDHLREMPSLKELRLNGTSITDKGIQKLTKLKRLMKLSVTRTKVTQSGVDAFNRVLPRCEVQIQ